MSDTISTGNAEYLVYCGDAPLGACAELVKAWLLDHAAKQRQEIKALLG